MEGKNSQPKTAKVAGRKSETEIIFLVHTFRTLWCRLVLKFFQKDLFVLRALLFVTKLFLSKEGRRYESNRIREKLISFCKLELQEETEFVCFLQTIYYSKMKRFPTRTFLRKRYRFDDDEKTKLVLLYKTYLFDLNYFVIELIGFDQTIYVMMF